MRGKPEWWLCPASLVVDIIGLPILLGVDIANQSYINILIPLGNFLGRVLNLIPKEVIEFLWKSAVFLVPLPVLALGAYGACTLIGLRSLTADIKGITECAVNFVSSMVCPKVVAGVAAGIAIGSMFAGGGER